MTLALQKLSAQNAHAMLARELGGAFGDLPLRRSLAADHIRSALYANAALGNEHNFSPAVHTSRLLTSVRKTLDLLWPGTATEHLREAATTGGAAQHTLDSLNAFGAAPMASMSSPLRTMRSGVPSQ